MAYDPFMSAEQMAAATPAGAQLERVESVLDLCAVSADEGGASHSTAPHFI